MNRSQSLLLFQNYLIVQKRLSKNSVLSYSRDIKSFIEFLKNKKLQIKKLTLKDFEKFFTTLEKSNLAVSSLHRKASALVSFSQFLHSKKAISSPIPGTTALVCSKLKRGGFVSKMVTHDEIMQILEQLNHQESLKSYQQLIIISFLYFFGLRVSELVNLKLKDIDSCYANINILGKGGKRRILPIPKFFASFVKTYLEQMRPSLAQGLISDKLFFSLEKKGSSLDRSYIFTFVKKRLQVSPHKLRHSAATHMIQSGANLRVVQTFLGHSKIDTVQIYTHLDLSKLRQDYDLYHPRAHYK